MNNQTKILWLSISAVFYLINLNAQNNFQPVQYQSVSQTQETTGKLEERFTLYGGSSVPIGDFRKGEHNFWEATSGFTIGMQYVSGKNVGLLVDASYSNNTANCNTVAPYGVSPNLYRWDFYKLLIGLKYEMTLFNDCSIMLVPLLGIGITSSPYVHYNYELPGHNFFSPDIPIKIFYDIEVESNTRIGATGGTMVQLDYNIITFGVRWLSTLNAHPYTKNIFYLDPSTGPSSSSDNQDISIQFIQMYIGFKLR
jgi:hypothetical protein